MKRRYNLIYRTMSEEEIKEQIKIWGNTKDMFGELMFDPNNPDHTELPAMILMKCVHFGYEEEIEAEIVEEIMDMEGGEYPNIMCPKYLCKKRQLN